MVTMKDRFPIVDHYRLAIIIIVFFYLEVPEIQFITSQRGGTVILYKGHRYNNTGSQTRWYCGKYSQGCRSSIIVSNKKFIKEVGEHKHSGTKDLFHF